MYQSPVCCISNTVYWTLSGPHYYVLISSNCDSTSSANLTHGFDWLDWHCSPRHTEYSARNLGVIQVKVMLEHGNAGDNHVILLQCVSIHRCRVMPPCSDSGKDPNLKLSFNFAFDEELYRYGRLKGRNDIHDASRIVIFIISSTAGLCSNNAKIFSGSAGTDVVIA